MAVGIADIEKKCIGDAVAAGAALDVFEIPAGGHHVAKVQNVHRGRHPIGKMVQARAFAVGDGEIMHVAFAMHPGRCDTAVRPVFLGIFGQPKTEPRVKIDGVFVELAAGIEVRDIEHGVAAPDDVERWIEDVRWCRHVASLVKLVVDYSVIASEATQSIFLGSRGWIASSQVLLAMTEMSDAFCSHDESGPSL